MFSDGYKIGDHHGHPLGEHKMADRRKDRHCLDCDLGRNGKVPCAATPIDDAERQYGNCDKYIERFHLFAPSSAGMLVDPIRPDIRQFATKTKGRKGVYTFNFFLCQFKIEHIDIVPDPFRRRGFWDYDDIIL